MPGWPHLLKIVSDTRTTALSGARTVFTAVGAELWCKSATLVMSMPDAEYDAMLHMLGGRTCRKSPDKQTIA